MFHENMLEIVTLPGHIAKHSHDCVEKSGRTRPLAGSAGIAKNVMPITAWRCAV
jgi:hypothetical protein